MTIPQNNGYFRREFDIDTNVQVFVASYSQRISSLENAYDRTICDLMSVIKEKKLINGKNRRKEKNTYLLDLFSLSGFLPVKSSNVFFFFFALRLSRSSCSMK